MCTSPQPASSAPRAEAANISQTSVFAERAYQCVTIAAMLWLLGSLWLFR
jgi:hypothetical protein